VRDPAVHLEVLREVVEGLVPAGLVGTDVTPSPIRGADGNVEFLLRAAKHGALVDDGTLVAAVDGTAKQGTRS
jgi:23S rRNA (cytidine1920-2'-O)/16S rRNA (cytidine1409-2'-O)-methyltransferase